MANIYVRSTDGNDADDGSTWALAKATVTGAAAIESAGDTIWVSQNHAGSTASTVTITLAGLRANPVRLLCGNDAAEPPTSLATTGSIETTGNSSINLVATTNGHSYVYGLVFNCGAGGANSATLSLGATVTGFSLTVEACDLKLATTTASRFITLNGTTGTMVLKNCRFKFSNATQSIRVDTGKVLISGGSFISGSTANTGGLFTLNSATSSNADLDIEGIDLTNAGSAAPIFVTSANNGVGTLLIRNSKLPTSWTGTLAAAEPSPNQRLIMHNCDSGDTNYRLWIESYGGSIRDETTLVKTGGASDGTTPISWKLVSSANVLFHGLRLRTGEIAKRNDTTGSSVTVTVDILHDSVTNLKDNEVWLEVQYLGTSGFPLALFVSDSMADVLATPADQTASSATWTTTGMTNPNKQKLSVSFTPQEKGYFHASVRVAKASYTIYVDPELQVS